MKILQVARQFSPAVGGIQSMVLHLCQHLTSRGHRCDVLTLNRRFDTWEKLPSFQQIEQVGVYRIPFVGFHRYPIAPSVLRHISGYDIIHVHAVDFFIDCLGFTRLLHNKPLVVSTHGGFFHTRWAYKLKRIYFHTITRLVLTQFDRVVCDSRHDSKLFQSIVPVSKLHVIPNGIEFEQFARLDRNQKPGSIISVGRIQTNKRIDRLIRVFAAVNQRLPRTTLTIIGADWEGLLADFEDLIRELNLVRQVKFLGMVNDEVLKRHLREAQVWICASEYESFGIALLEAMAVGIVPVVQPIEAFKELIVDGQNGFLADYSDVAQATQTLCKVLQLESTAASRIAQRAQRTASIYAWESIVRQFEELYSDVLSYHRMDHYRA